MFVSSAELWRSTHTVTDKTVPQTVVRNWKLLTQISSRYITRSEFLLSVLVLRFTDFATNNIHVEIDIMDISCNKEATSGMTSI